MFGTKSTTVPITKEMVKAAYRKSKNRIKELQELTM